MVLFLCFASSSSFSLIFFVFHPSLFFLRSCSIFALLLFRWSSWLESLAPYFLLTLSCAAFSYFFSFFCLLRLSFYSVSLFFFFDDSCLLIVSFFPLFVVCLLWLSTIFVSVRFPRHFFVFFFFISQSCRLRFPIHADLFRDVRRPVVPFTVIRHSMLPSSSLISCRIRHALSTRINQGYAVLMFSKIRNQ